jgi:hypothetical protein
MDSSVALLAIASFLGGLLVTSRVIGWTTGLLLVFRQSPPGNTSARVGFTIAALFFHSGPWLLVITAGAIYYAASSPRASYLWALVGGLALAVVFIGAATLRASLQLRRPLRQLTPERLLVLRRRFFWGNSLVFAFCMPAFFAFQASLSFARDAWFLAIVFVASFAVGWMWSWFMWQWYGAALKVREKARQRRERENVV